jgi:hypothetical protein
MTSKDILILLKCVHCLYSTVDLDQESCLIQRVLALHVDGDKVSQGGILILPSVSEQFVLENLLQFRITMHTLVFQPACVTPLSDQLVGCDSRPFF